MRKMFKISAAVAVAGGALLAMARPARAATIDCNDKTAVPNPVYIAGSTASKPFLVSMAKVLATTSTPVSIVYAGSASCQGLADVASTPTMPDISAAWSYINSSGTFVSCFTSANVQENFIADIGVADVYPSSCLNPMVTPSATQTDFHGPIQPMEIVVPWTSSEFSISYDAAYTVFGFAAQAPYVVSPWNDPTAIFTRDDTSGTQTMTANAIGLLASKWLHGLTPDAAAPQMLTSSGVMLSTIQDANSTKPNTTIGILSAGTVDPAKSAPSTSDAGKISGGVKPLAFQAKDEDCGYYADSDLNHFDKINVRQGRYAIWGPIHFLANVDGSGNAVVNPDGQGTSGNVNASANAAVQALISVVTTKGLSATSVPTLQADITAQANAFFVPQCAMEVARSGEVNLTTSGGVSSYAPTGACGCYYESLFGATVSPHCQTCTSNTDCGDAGVYKVCNYGYCEAQ